MNEEYDGHDIDLDGHLAVQVVSECAFCLLFLSAQTLFFSLFSPASLVVDDTTFRRNGFLRTLVELLLIDATLLFFGGSMGRPGVRYSSPTRPRMSGFEGRLEWSMIEGTD